MTSRAQKILDLLPQGTKIPELTRKQYCNLVPNSNILSQISQNDTTPNTDEVNNYPVNENVLVATSSDVIESETQVLEEMPTITTLKPVVDTFDIELMPMVLVDDYSQILDIGIDNVSLNLPEADEEIDCTVDDTMYLQPSTSADITYCETNTIDDRPESPPISDRDVDYSPGSEHESGSDDSRNDAEMETNSTEEDVVSDVNGTSYIKTPWMVSPGQGNFNILRGRLELVSGTPSLGQCFTPKGESNSRSLSESRNTSELMRNSETRPKVSRWSVVEQSKIGRQNPVSKQCYYTGLQLKAYRSLLAYKYYESGFVIQVLAKRNNDETFVSRGKARHSQRSNEKPLQVWIIILKDSSISNAQCTRMAGLGEVCSHVAAVLFHLHARPEQNMACTEQLAT
ncbi:unnamed protein product [Phaedon cochleariae]|uniref:SWIM-type domain-containing protein n=1 Tax=Phaedon cochleariae TaxID=80249 RepID=A0A9N9S9B5_PHACE|nr:unnamed protein product [Phaedon cochleariae]